MDTLTLLRTTQSLGITTSFLMSGMYFISSYLFIPSILPHPTASTSTSSLSPHDATRVFESIYHGGASIFVPLALGCTAINAANAYLIPAQRGVYGGAALAALSTMGWTGIVMSSGINRLLKIREMSSEGQEEKRGEVVELMSGWRRHNYLRAGLAFVAGVLAVYGALW